MILHTKKAFTLTELLVWITIISILLLWVSSINFNRLNTKQKLEIFTNNIRANFENIRNNSLTWKWIWSNLDVPKNWKIEYSVNNSWTIISSSSLDWTNWDIFDQIRFENLYEISKIKCLKIDWTEDSSLDNPSQTWTIDFSWVNITLWWDCPNSSKILELTVKNQTDTKILEINTLNWLITTK